MKKIFLMVAIIAIFSTKFSFAQTKSHEALNQVLSTYYDLKNALATDKNDSVAEKARVFITKIEAVPHQDLPETQHKVWIEQSTLIKAKAKELTVAKNIATQRKAFEGISNPMIKLVKTINFNSDIVYIQHCPMAKASWLNEKESIENPYYGKMMFECGSVTETLKAN
ncbi:DUF3347 domain-containing protein [Pedobacter changchengzhani]|uniref:DUF3347 domain-containing protein n=1 Tax=Pedobacter changchengzhani TaxID=2529274 RepID=A0A4R5MNI5_9SPHI|nr:DUF3347 domain-containing protein [Pedobacter changchengzhani]TDG37324.1 DUF3347 domain-containing protein [Pedobacter changchengzhani]